MRTKNLHILFLLITAYAFAACNSGEKLYESGSTQTKTKKNSVAIGKFNKLLKNGDSDAKYAAAIRYYAKEDYGKALTLLEGLMSLYRGTAKAEQVHYYYANCNYNMGDYILAGYHFRTFVKNFSTSKHVEYCAYMNAYCFYLNSPEYSLEQVDTYLAIKEFHRFTTKYPKSDKIPECNTILDELRDKLDKKSYKSSMLYFNMTNYKSAVVAFENHIKDFPGSSHKEEFTFLTIKSYYLLAVNSIASKQKERFKSTVDSYIKFIDKYPKSKYLKDAENIYASALKSLK